MAYVNEQQGRMGEALQYCRLSATASGEVKVEAEGRCDAGQGLSMSKPHIRIVTAEEDGRYRIAAEPPCGPPAPVEFPRRVRTGSGPGTSAAPRV